MDIQEFLEKCPSAKLVSQEEMDNEIQKSLKNGERVMQVKNDGSKPKELYLNSNKK